MQEPEYAELENQRVHRIASLCVAIGYCVVSWISTDDFAYAFRAGMRCIFPLAFIWYAEALASVPSIQGWNIDAFSNPIHLRWAGWFLLLVPAFWMVVGWCAR